VSIEEELIDRGSVALAFLLTRISLSGVIDRRARFLGLL
jgi:hypothetical protein